VARHVVVARKAERGILTMPQIYQGALTAPDVPRLLPFLFSLEVQTIEEIRLRNSRASSFTDNIAKK
jgi:hypothetical protein